MGKFNFRFRRSLRVGGARINFTKTGIGLSAGVPGARYSVHSSGRKTTTFGIPGTGMYWRKDEVRPKNAKGVTAQASDTGGRPSAGWYLDPRGSAQLRWWDGTNWTSRVVVDGDERSEP